MQKPQAPPPDCRPAYRKASFSGADRGKKSSFGCGRYPFFRAVFVFLKAAVPASALPAAHSSSPKEPAPVRGILLSAEDRGAGRSAGYSRISGAAPGPGRAAGRFGFAESFVNTAYTVISLSTAELPVNTAPVPSFCVFHSLNSYPSFIGFAGMDWSLRESAAIVFPRSTRTTVRILSPILRVTLL